MSGTYLATLVVYGLFISLFMTTNPMPWWLSTIIAWTIGTVAFAFGRREAQAVSIASLTWLILLLALPTILAVVLATIVDQATIGETLAVTVAWSIGYLALPLLFRSSARLPETSAVQ
jgi:hypothetical protein